jgi:hypothetical protein
MGSLITLVSCSGYPSVINRLANRIQMNLPAPSVGDGEN